MRVKSTVKIKKKQINFETKRYIKSVEFLCCFQIYKLNSPTHQKIRALRNLTNLIKGNAQ